jgi:NAD(P)H-dependent flavin oxidoreductase YrpB (nitropropane dioxygenase family)
VQEIREKARELMKGTCRVCPVCDGRACAGEVPGMGGVGTGNSFKANVKALAAKTFVMRLVHQVSQPSSEVELLGRKFALPVLAAPIGGVALNMGGQVPEEVFVTAVLEGCAQQGTLGCSGDGAPPEVINGALAALSAVEGQGIPVIKPWGEEEFFAKVDQVKAAGATMVGMDLDAAGLITLALLGRPVGPKPVEELQKIAERLRPLKFILKGIMSPQDALLAVEAGVDAIVVSNHGGRVLDFTPGTAEVLPEIAAAVKGKITILADGGVRSGGDVLKMLALGADAVLIGRPLAVAALGGGAEGVAKYLEQIKGELLSAMVLTACPHPGAAGPHMLFSSAGP